MIIYFARVYMKPLCESFCLSCESFHTLTEPLKYSNGSSKNHFFIQSLVVWNFIQIKYIQFRSDLLIFYEISSNLHDFTQYYRLLLKFPWILMKLFEIPHNFWILFVFSAIFTNRFKFDWIFRNFLKNKSNLLIF